MNKFALSTLASVALLATGTASATTIISEDFTTGFGSFADSGNVYGANGATYGPCCGTSAAYTDFFVAFGGGNAPSGIISSPFATALGKVYTVTFDYGALGGGSETLTVAAGGASNLYNPVANNNLFAAFQTASFSFVGTGSATALSFTSNGVNNVDAIIDNVTVTAVPEPATWAMMIAGFGMIGFGLRGRRKQTARVTFA